MKTSNVYVLNRSQTKGRQPKRSGLIVATILVIVAVAIVLATGAIDRSTGTYVEYTTVTVAPGDTLWSLARSIVGKEGDPRRMVYRIKQLNDLEAGNLRPGMTLTIPLR